MTKKIISLALTCLFLAACKTEQQTIVGDLSVNQALVLVASDGEVVRLEPNLYTSRVMLESNKILFAWKEKSDPSIYSWQIKMNMPKTSKKIKSLNDVNFSAAELKQKFGVRGFESKTSVAKAGETIAFEKCEYITGSHKECGYREAPVWCETNDQGERTCSSETSTQWVCDEIQDYFRGNEERRYIPHQVTSISRIIFTAANSNEQLAVLDETHVYEEKQYTFKGKCK